jgi:ubiquinone biosynthesis protein COQ9
MHVPFDGWSETAFKAAIEDTGVAPAVARGLFPRGAIDLAAAFHRHGDDLMAAALKARDLSGLRFRDKVALAVRLRLEAVEDRESVRRGATLFSLPMHAAEGARLVWGTADRIWTALGDTSQDINWYTKRATLSGVYSSTVLYWLGDESLGHQATWAFLDRRIDNVMQIEQAKANIRKAPGIGKLFQQAESFASRIRPPKKRRDDLPGGWTVPR